MLASIKLQVEIPPGKWMFVDFNQYNSDDPRSKFTKTTKTNTVYSFTKRVSMIFQFAGK